MSGFFRTAKLATLTPDQAMLVRAALGPEQEVREALTAWLARADLAELDAASRRLIPLAYDRARREGIDHPALPVLKGVKRYTWYDNQLLFREAAGAIRALRAAGIEVMPLKGAALTLRYYRDMSLRPMEDFDVLVPTADAQRAFHVFRELGYSAEPGRTTSSDAVRCFHAAHFLVAPGRDLDLHWHLLPSSVAPDADDDFWAASSATDFHSESIRILDPADQLLHVLVHGTPSGWDAVAPIRWIPDAIAIIGDGQTVAWPRLLGEARKHGVVLVVREMLTWLEHLLQPPIPPEVLVELDRLPVSDQERREFRWRFQVEESILRSIALVVLDYKRIRQQAGKPRISLPDYLRVLLRARWQLEGQPPLAPTAGRKVAARLKALARPSASV